MKKVIKFLPAMAILLASGLAVASHATYNTPNVKNTNPGTGTPNWVALNPGEEIECDSDESCQCLAHFNGTTYSDFIYGYQE
jgi:hypothetical protein